MISLAKIIKWKEEYKKVLKKHPEKKKLIEGNILEQLRYLYESMYIELGKPIKKNTSLSALMKEIDSMPPQKTKFKSKDVEIYFSGLQFWFAISIKN